MCTGGYVKGATMNPDTFDETLAACARQPVPTSPEQLATGVWREIERRRRQFSWLRLFPVLTRNLLQGLSVSIEPFGHPAMK